jgi:hypothetical protein
MADAGIGIAGQVCGNQHLTSNVVFGDKGGWLVTSFPGESWIVNRDVVSKVSTNAEGSLGFGKLKQRGIQSFVLPARAGNGAFVLRLT